MRKTLTLGLLLSLVPFAAWSAPGQSCFGTSCRDKIVPLLTCFVRAPTGQIAINLRSMPATTAQAVAVAASEEKVTVHDQSGKWSFVLTSDSGGWVPRAALNNCMRFDPDRG
jgi:uncharacterized protein YgiM (DUF1202 family)